MQCSNKTMATNVATMLYQHVFKLHGLPCQIMSDRGTQFAVQVFQEFCKNLGIKSSMSTAYHPQTNGQTEQVNQSLKNYLQIVCNHWQNDCRSSVLTRHNNCKGMNPACPRTQSPKGSAEAETSAVVGPRQRRSQGSPTPKGCA
jgi:hypothetical protein